LWFFFYKKGNLVNRSPIFSTAGVLSLALPMAVFSQGKPASDASVPVASPTNSASPDADVFGFQKPASVTDLSGGVKEGFDNNLLGVSGHGLRPEESFFTTVLAKVGFNFAPLLGDQNTLQTLSLSYLPESSIYYNAPQENYFANRFGNIIRGKTDNFSFSLENYILYNAGSVTAPIYAVNQTSPAEENDRFRNFYAFAMPRERRDQYQDRAAIVLQYDIDRFFIRPVASLLDYTMKTDLRNNTVAPNIGYQNFPDRGDVNGGADVGYHIAPPIAITLGYRYGHQYQAQFPEDVSPVDRHYASNDYQRLLLGLEGQWHWLTYKLLGGPDFRDYNPNAPVNDFHPIKYYGEAVISAKINDEHSLTFNYKQWQSVASTGYVPYYDSSFALIYHWNATPKLGLDLGGRILEADFTGGNENGIAVPSETSSLRDDRQYSVLAGVNYAFTTRFSVNANYSYDRGVNLLGNLPPALAAVAEYRDFSHQTVTVGVLYNF
jgi:hypothetical protein